MYATWGEEEFYVKVHIYCTDKGCELGTINLFNSSSLSLTLTLTQTPIIEWYSLFWYHHVIAIFLELNQSYVSPKT